MKIRNLGTWIGVFFLIVIEQSIKIVINKHYFYERFPILPPILYFAPMYNKRYSWFNSMLQINGTKFIQITFVAIMTILIFLFFKYLNSRLGTIRIFNIMFTFIFSGALCSLIDKVFWDGSLDYIMLKGYFTFDLKDIYINVFIGLLIISLIFKNKSIKAIDEKSILKDFYKYILRKQ